MTAWQAELDAHQIRVAERVLAEESERRHHLVVYLSGAHAYGFPSVDSDLDLKAIHIAPTADLVGLAPPDLHASRLQVVDGVEIDYGSNELGRALARILAGDGNFIERVLGRLTVCSDPALETLRPLVQDTLSRNVHRHYRGFARHQLEAAAAGPANAKRILYAVRTALTGTHLLRTGQIEPDLRVTAELYGFSDAVALIERKRAGERIALAEGEAGRWLTRAQAALAVLDRAVSGSPLPEDVPNREQVEAWLLDQRRSHFDGLQA